MQLQTTVKLCFLFHVLPYHFENLNTLYNNAHKGENNFRDLHPKHTEMLISKNTKYGNLSKIAVTKLTQYSPNKTTYE